MDDNLNLQNNSELNQALQEFEVKSTVPPVGGIEENTNINIDPEMPKMVQFVIKHSFGLVKEQKHAEYVVLGIALIMLSISLFIFLKGDNASSVTESKIKNIERLLPPPPKK